MFLRNLLIFCICFISLAKSEMGISPFISAGENADIVELPFLISIQIGSIHLCMGSLISENFGLSSGRCLATPNMASLVIEYGSTIIGPGNQNRTNTVGIKNIIFHPQFNSTTYENDIAIIEPTSEIRLIGFHEPFAFLASSGSRFSSGVSATHAGWGHTALNQRNTILQRANLQILSHQECIDAVGERKLPFFNSICAMDESVICTGDLGSPLLVNRVLVGIASFRSGNECENTPGQFPNVYTAVSFYIGWIERVTGINYRVNTFLSRN